MVVRKPHVWIAVALSHIMGGAARKTRYTHTKTAHHDNSNTVCYDEHEDQIACPHRPWTTLDTVIVCVVVAIGLLLIALAIYLTYFKGVCRRHRSRSLPDGLISSLRSWRCWRSKKYHKVTDTEQASTPAYNAANSKYDPSATIFKSTIGGVPPIGMLAPGTEPFNVATLCAYPPEGSESTHDNSLHEKGDQWPTYDVTSPGYAALRPFPAPKDTLH